jgi:hypothetical protein
VRPIRCVIAFLRLIAASQPLTKVTVTMPSTLMTHRVAAGVLEQMLPVGAGNDPETLRCHTLKIGDDLRDQPVVRPGTAAPSITVTVDSTFIRSCEDGERHLEVRVGNVETEPDGRQVFGAVAKADTDIKELIRRSLDAVGRTEDRVLTAFTDGCGRLLRDEPRCDSWIAMRSLAPGSNDCRVPS